MVNKNKALRRTLGNLIGVTVIALVWIGTSFAAHGQWREDASTVSFQSSEFAACGCDGAKLGGFSRRSSGRRVGPVSRAKQNVALLSHRETPPGNMGLHFPYQATQMYYYRRPYNDYHVPGHLAESKGSPAESTLGENLGYSNHIFEEAHESAELYFGKEIPENEVDGLLEYVDWQEHQQQRLNWEGAPNYHVEQREQAFPSTDHAPLQNSKRRAADLQRKRAQDDEPIDTPATSEAGFSIRPASSSNSSNAEADFLDFERE